MSFGSYCIYQQQKLLTSLHSHAGALAALSHKGRDIDEGSGQSLGL